MALLLTACGPDRGGAASPTDTAALCETQPVVELGAARYLPGEVVPLQTGEPLHFDVGPLTLWRTFVGFHAEGVPEAVRVEVRMVRARDLTVLVDWAGVPLWISLPHWEPGTCSGEAQALEVLLPGWDVLDLCDLHESEVLVELGLFDQDDRLVARDQVVVQAQMAPDGCPWIR